MLDAMFTVLKTAGSGFVDFFKELLVAIVSLFYTAGAEGAAGTLTDIGVLTVASIAVSFVIFILSWVRKLIKLRG